MKKRKKIKLIITILILFSIILAAIFVPIFSQYRYDGQNLQEQLQYPNTRHFFGTDLKGRDLFVRVMYGLRISLLIGILATLVSVIIGTIYGLISGYSGGKTDLLMMRIVDILYSLPFIFLVIIIMVYVGRNIYVIFIALGMVQWLTIARIVRGQTLMLKNSEFVLLAKANGASNIRIIFKHILINLIDPVIVYAALLVPTVILEESFLSFIGLGVQAPKCSLGSLAADGAQIINPVIPYMHLVIFPILFLALLLFLLEEGRRLILST